MGKGTMGQSQMIQPTDNRWMLSEATKSCDTSGNQKEKKSMKMGDIASAEEDDDPDDVPEGFHLQKESPHCINMTRADDYQAYLRQIVLEFERLFKSGATDVRENYSKVIQSMFWVVKANKQTILNGADPDEVLASIPDPKCRAWQMKLNGKTAVDPGTLVDDTEIGPQTALEMMKMKSSNWSRRSLSGKVRNK